MNPLAVDAGVYRGYQDMGGFELTDIRVRRAPEYDAAAKRFPNGHLEFGGSLGYINAGARHGCCVKG